MTLPGVSRPPAASMPPSSITAPSSTVAPMPTKARSFSVQAWMIAAWPDRDVVADNGRPRRRIHMDDRAVLDVGAGADADDVGVAAQTQETRFRTRGPISTSPITAAVGRDQGVRVHARTDPVERDRAGRDRQRCSLRHRPAAVSASGMPSIRPMFCTAAPDAPLPRLSSRAISTAWRCSSLASPAAPAVGAVQRLRFQLAGCSGRHHTHHSLPA